MLNFLDWEPVLFKKLLQIMVWVRLCDVYFKFHCYNFYIQQGGYIILTILTRVKSDNFLSIDKPRQKVIYLNAD